MVKNRLHALTNHPIVARLTRPRSFGRFAFIGVVNTVVGVGNFPVLFWMLGDALSVNALVVLGWVISTTSAFLLHKFITFQSKGVYHWEGAKFLVLSLLTLGINIAVMDIASLFIHGHTVLIQVAITTILSAALMIMNFFGMDRYIFKPKV